jgi:hypothetical protein
MPHTVPASLLIGLLALGLTSLAADGPPWSTPRTRSLSAAAMKSRLPRQEGQIACTIVGCIRIPPKCHPEMGYTSDGTPTGFDIVVCPGAPPLYGIPQKVGVRRPR